MKRKELVQAAEKYCGHIEKISRRIPGAFEMEDIHELRVEYKKLRAFLRLTEHNDKAGPAQLKSLYKAAGAVRDLQLFQAKVVEKLAQEPNVLPVLQQHLQKDLFNKKIGLVKEIEQADFHKTGKHIKEKLPALLRDATIEQFIRQKVAAIRLALLAAGEEKELHTIRKHLKDIIYNIRIFQQEWGVAFPIVAWKSNKLLNDTADMLGEFNDRCIFFSVIRERLNMATLSGEEKEILQGWQQEWVQEEKDYIPSLLLQVRQLHIAYDFV